MVLCSHHSPITTLPEVLIGWFKVLQLDLQLDLNLSLNSGKLNEVEANPDFRIRKFFEVEVEVGVAFETTS